MNTSIQFPMIDAVKVQFIQPIFEDSFVETGMKAWLTKVEVKDDMFNLYFDFTEFEAENAKYFTCQYYPNVHTKELERETGRKLFTAIEAKQYSPKESWYFSLPNDSTDLELLSRELTKFLRVIA